MIVFCYHNGALGHATSALIECCTKEGGRNIPPFYHDMNLHHFSPEQKLFCIKHPHCDIAQEKKLGNFVITSTALNEFGRFLVLYMGLKKWNKNQPDHNHRVVYDQYGSSYGEQLEILSLTLRDKVQSDTDWFVDADNVLDITNYWNNVPAVIEWLSNCGFTPVTDRVELICNQITESNQQYYNTIKQCVTIVDDVMANKEYHIDLSYYEIAMCHAMLLTRYNKPHQAVKLMTSPPVSTRDLFDIFHD